MMKKPFKLESPCSIYDCYEYVLKDLPMGRALVAVSRVTGGGYDPLQRQKETDPPYLVFSNVNCRKDDHILEYANRYGLPFNPNRLYKDTKESGEAASRAALPRASYGFESVNFGELLRGDKIPCEYSTEHYERMELDRYRKTAKGGVRAEVYPLDDFWCEVDKMRRVLKWMEVVKGGPSSKDAPGSSLSAEYLKDVLNHEISGTKAAVFIGYQEDDTIGSHPGIFRQYVPIDFKQALYAALIDDIADDVKVSRCKYYCCKRFFTGGRKGKIFCSEDCRNNAGRMKFHWKTNGQKAAKREARNGKKTRQG
ncbi:MAG TPA: hypothetical protein EYQ01_11280 [Nitrospira sp.]|nr:hypothetical protein [Candidatus Manganitrophaceae bacterium]